MKTRDEIIAMLVAVARAAYSACDDAFEGQKTIKIERDDFDALSAALDALDELPDPPGTVATGPAKAEYVLSQPPTTPSVEPARPAWAETLAQIRSIVFDQVNRHVAMTQSHREWVANDISDRIEAELAKHAPASLQSPAPAQPVTATRELVEALKEMVGAGEFCVNIMHHHSDPKNSKPFVWKDVALQMYAAFQNLPAARQALAAHEATRSLSTPAWQDGAPPSKP